ncbi:hypothetical protein NV379_16300 [Paenibacillus sp. N1-5-1-14]|uniref:hypothetical protein n=1 Tax=Paenibacillus radicibacter TaxID=2972488 RepID=UPI0021592B4E|nr:hypothetical protein [Paenibacillus radicibacter]MCR8644216.1 hypothetical protein [Paenibacillus radicibacter]
MDYLPRKELESIPIFLGFVSLLLAVFFFIMFIMSYAYSDPALGFRKTGLILFLLFSCLTYPLLAVLWRPKKDEDNEFGVIAGGWGYHVQGLPLSPKTECILTVTEDQLTIEGGGTVFHLTLEQIRSVELTNEIEIEHVMDSFETSRPIPILTYNPYKISKSKVKVKEIKNYNFFLVFHYTNNDGELASILLDVGDRFIPINSFVTKLEPLLTNNETEVVHL